MAPPTPHPAPPFRRVPSPDFPALEAEVLAFWNEHQVFAQSLEQRATAPVFSFYEGPPSANGHPGIHHVMSRTLKDLVCRYQSLRGYRVERKAGWDAHGLPVELQVEKELGITKQDIGKRISVADYNAKCREAVFRYKNRWDELTTRMGYWVDLDDPYITCNTPYIESCWNLLQRLFAKGLLYKGYTIQPYSPAAGTGLSSHELNQPGCYREVTDLSLTALFADADHPGEYLLAWTTTPWTLPGNAALAVGPDIQYRCIETRMPGGPQKGAVIKVWLAEARVEAYFKPEARRGPDEPVTDPDGSPRSPLPWKPLHSLAGRELVGRRYAQLLPLVPVDDGAFRVIAGDFVTTDDGTGIVHIAPTFGADDKRVAEAAGVPAVLVPDPDSPGLMPTVDRQGRFAAPVGQGLLKLAEALLGESGSEFYRNLLGRARQALAEGGLYVRREFANNEQYPDANELIAALLREGGQLLRTEKYVHNYPHCWRTDKPVLYYPLDSWFIRTSALRDRLVELNHSIRWKPESTGTGRFGHWLQHLTDWNLSRSRFWGTPLPIWANANRSEVHCLGSLHELRTRALQAVDLGLVRLEDMLRFLDDNHAWFARYMQQLTLANPQHPLAWLPHRLAGLNGAEARFELEADLRRHTPPAEQLAWLRAYVDDVLLHDLHRPFVDELVLADSTGQPMRREPDLVDVWFDSGAMPFAQWHYPFENQEAFARHFPADFIAEGIDQTRGWFFTLHAIAGLLEDQVAFRTVMSNGLVLDAEGNKMSKRKGNVLDPFEVIARHGADVTRWYMVENAPPWEDLRFSLEGLAETQRKLFNTLFYTYDFLATYANIDAWQPEVRPDEAQAYTEMDQWLLSLLQGLVQEVTEALDDYDPTRAARALQHFATEELSNWYVRLNRRRFWKGEPGPDKQAAYATLHTCLRTLAVLMCPLAPFFPDWLFRHLHPGGPTGAPASVHLQTWPQPQPALRQPGLERRMQLAQRLASLVHGLRKKHRLKVRQPLAKLVVPALTADMAADLQAIGPLLAAEVNVLEVQVQPDAQWLPKQLRPNWKALGPRLGKNLPLLGPAVAEQHPRLLAELESTGQARVQLSNGETAELHLADVEIVVQDIPGFLTASDHGLTVALDTRLTPELQRMGLARELVNRIQNLRKDRDLDVTDRIALWVHGPQAWMEALNDQQAYICAEVLATALSPQHHPLAVAQDIEGDLVHLHLEKAV